MFDFQHLKSG